MSKKACTGVACGVRAGHGWRRVVAGADDVTRGQPFRSEDPQSDLDHGLHRAQPRLHDPTTRCSRSTATSRSQPQMVRQVDDLARPSSLGPFYSARQARVPTARRSRPRTWFPHKRWAARLPYLASCCGPRSPTSRPRSQDLQDPAQGANRHHAGGAGGQPSGAAFIMPRKVAETGPFKQIGSYNGSGPVHLRIEENEWKPGDKTRSTSRNPKYKPRPSRPPACRRQDRQARPGRMVAIPPRSADGDERPAEERDRHDQKDAAARPAQAQRRQIPA